jgi:hypothetical protein
MRHISISGRQWYDCGMIYVCATTFDVFVVAHIHPSRIFVKIMLFLTSAAAQAPLIIVSLCACLVTTLKVIVVSTFVIIRFAECHILMSSGA